MNDEPKQIFAKRLDQARKMRGLSLRALAQEMQGTVTSSAIQKYENAQMLPSSTVLLALAAALKQSVDFFFRPPTVSIEKIEFRKRSKLTGKQQESLREQASDFFERYLEVEDVLGLNAPFKNPLQGITIQSPQDIEAAAEKLRLEWKLGQSPLPNVLELLEEHQIKVYELDAPTSFDGMSGWAGQLPVVVVNRSFPPDRKRLTALHELAHLLLEIPAAKFDEKAIERLCHSFAGAMLIPKEVFLAKFGGKRPSVTLYELCEIKKDFGISIAAIMARARGLDLITQDRYVQFSIQMKTKGWHVKEPVEYCGTEQSNRFEQLLHRATSTDLISLTKAASLAGKSLSVFRDSLQLVP